VITIVVDNRIRLVREDLEPRLEAAIRSDFEHRNPDRRDLKKLREAVSRLRRDPKRFKRAYAMLKQAENAPASITTWRKDEVIASSWPDWRDWTSDPDEVIEQLTLPRGAMGKLRERLADFGVSYRVVDRRSSGNPAIGAPGRYTHRVELWDFQEQLVESALKVENCLWRSPTGSGKTTAAIRFIVRAGLPALVVVWTGNLFDQWVRRLRNELGLSESEIGMIRGGRERLKPITVAMQQSLWQGGIDTYADCFGTFVLDEVDRAAARTFFDVVDAVPARFRLGISADERRKDRKEFLVYDLFGDVAHEVPEDELVARGIVLDCEIRIVPTDFDPDWYRDLAPEARALVSDRLLEDMTRCRERNELAARLAADEVKAGEQTLIFSSRVEHCRTLEADARAQIDLPGSATGLLIGGGDNEQEFERVIAGIADRSVVLAVGTVQAVGYGLDLPPVSRGVATTPVHNNRTLFRQMIGRLKRTSSETGKTDAALYYLWDPCFGQAPLRQLVKWAKSVVVWDGQSWIDARHYLRASKEGFDDENAIDTAEDGA
jgi:superfamily II DNA or RNA helicase